MSAIGSIGFAIAVLKISSVDIAASQLNHEVAGTYPSEEEGWWHLKVRAEARLVYAPKHQGF